MSSTTLVLFALAGAGLFALGRRRALFPYLLVFVLGLEYFSPGAADSLFTIPKMGFLALVASQIGAGRISRLFTTRGLTFPLVILVCYMSMTILWSVNPERSQVRAISLVLLLVLFVVVQGFVRSPRDLEAFWRAFLVYGLCNAALTVYQVFSGLAMFLEASGARAGGLGVNPTEGSFYTGISVLILIAYFSLSRPIALWMRQPLVQLAAFGVLSAGMLTTGSRGGIVALGCATLYLMAVVGRATRRRARAVARHVVLGLLAGAVVLALPGVAESIVARFAETGADQLGNRLNIWTEMWASIRQHPLVGTGLNTTAVATGRYALTVTYSSHNTPLGTLLDGGAVGLFLFLALAIRIVLVLRRIRRLASEDLHIHGTILTAVLVMGGVTMLAHDLMFLKFLWTALALVEATNYLLVNNRSARYPLRQAPRRPPAPAQAAP